MDESTWRAKAEKDNRGRSPDTLAYRPEPGVTVGPLAWDAPKSSRALHPGGQWLSMRTHDTPNSAAIRADLDGGIDVIRLERRAFRSARDLASAFKNVDLEKARWGFAEGDFGSAAALMGIWRGLGLDSTPRVNFGLDPVTRFGRDGFSTGDPAQHLQAAAELAHWTTDHVEAGRTFHLEASTWHDAGADDSLALALGLSSLVSALRAMEDQGLSTEQAFGQVGLRMAVGGRFLLGIATLRATRRLLERVGELCGVDVAVPITATAAARERTERDPWVNILRITTAGFAGVVGGADCIDLPTFAAEDPAHARLARNTHKILREEAHLDRVADPAGGAFALEQLTDQIARRAWKQFQEVERQGGLLTAVQSGWVARTVQQARTRREKRIRTRTDGILGVSRFPDLDEDRLPRAWDEENPTAVTSGAPPVDTFAQLLPAALSDTLAELNAARTPLGVAVRCEPCPPVRLAAVFERFRDRSGAPTAFVAPLGPLSSHTARTAWGVELLAAGGIRCQVGTGTTAAEAVAGYRASGARIAVVSATGERFTKGALLAHSLSTAGAQVWVLGDPKDHRAAFEAAGASGFLHQGIDVITTLQSLWENA